MRGHVDRDIARDVLSYFLRNPHAADDLEGVARWRLLNQTVHRGVEETSLALDWLVEHGFLGRVSRAETGAIFSLRPEHRSEAEAFVSGTAEKGSQGPDIPE